MGKPLSEETKRRIGKANRGKRRTAAERLAVSLALKNRPKTADHKLKIGLANKGKKRSEADKRKMGIARRKAWEATQTINSTIYRCVAKDKYGIPIAIERNHYNENGTLITRDIQASKVYDPR